MLEKRAPYREAHIAHMKKQLETGNVILAGVIDHPPTGALITFRNLKPNDIEQIAQQDPYFINGIVTKYTIKPYIAVAGDPSVKDDLIKIWYCYCIILQRTIQNKKE